LSYFLFIMPVLTNIYTLSFILLTLVAATTFALPYPVPSENSKFARCEACHPDSSDTTKSGEHYRMKCTDCHTISEFSQNRHTSTIKECGDCHAGIGFGRQHERMRYFP